MGQQLRVACSSLVVLVSLALARPASAADRTFPEGSLIIPMDLSYQSRGLFQAYGLIYQLLRHDVTVHWVIDPDKTWHAAPCNTTGDLCSWDCGIEGSGVKCNYPTASPDFTATTKVIWDDSGTAARDSVLGTHRYRGGPFVIDAADHAKAIAIIDAWNDQSKWATNPWATRTVFRVVTVHEATAAFTGNSARELIAAPSIAVFSDGNENIATGYLRAAGIPQSNGSEFPSAKCGASNCGPGTTNPDMLTPVQIAGDLGTCDAPNYDHKNGALFKPDGTPAYCQIMSMHWGVSDRERVTCEGGCPATQAQCTGQRFTFNGHEVVAEVRAFLGYATHFFAQCHAVNAYENLSPNPAWPYLDDAGRDGHFLTTTGTPPLCPTGTCTDGNYQCVQNACAGQACCLPKPATWQNMPGFEVAAQPSTNTIKVLRPDVPYNQLDGAFGSVGGSEPAYNLSTYLNSTYKNNRQVTLLTGPTGPGAQDVWMSGYLDGCSDIILKPGGQHRSTLGCEGKISYLGGHSFSTNVPVSSGSASQGTRLFLNALFEAQCTVAPGGGGGGGGSADSDGDGVDDGSDPYPDDPFRCGDSDGDGCDDCSSGTFDPDNDCEADGGGGGMPGGCCETGGTTDSKPLVLALVVGLLLLRRRRPRNA
jgi:MYXO-CTERM domain-containing protein